jgi:uncharacterized membrane protein
MVRVMNNRRFLLFLAATAALAGLAFFIARPDLLSGQSPVEMRWAIGGGGPRLFILGALAALAFIFMALAVLPDRHLMPLTFFNTAERRAIATAIAAAERRSSGEVRVHLARRTRADTRREAEEAFKALGMTATRLNNGVLIYITVADHRFAVIGDTAIDAVAPPGFWDQTRDLLAEDFRHELYAPGVIAAIGRVEELFVEHFPRTHDDVNELPDQLSTEE